MTSPADKIAALGLTLPEAAAPVANYVPYVISGNMVFISGQISKIGDEAIGGRLGCLLYTSPSPRDKRQSRMPSSA